MRAWASKGGAQVLRIAGVLTLAERPDAGVIELATIERAARLALYYLREAARIVGTASAPPVVRHAEALRAWCWESGRRFIHSRDALRFGPNAIRTGEVFHAAAALLEGSGWLRFVDGGMVLEGQHRRKVWEVRPQEAD